MTRRRYRKAVQATHPTIRPKRPSRGAKPPSAEKNQAISDALVFGVLATMIVVVLRSLISAPWPLIIAPLIGLATAGLVVAAHAVAQKAARSQPHPQPIDSPVDQDEPPPTPVVEPVKPIAVVPLGIPIASQQRQKEMTDWHFFLRETYSRRQTTRQFWVGRKMPSGNNMNRIQWKEYTERLRTAGLASRRHRNAPLELHGDYRQALDVFREML